MINVGSTLRSKRLSQSFTVYRKSGTWNAGRWTGTETSLTLSGVVSPAGQTDLEMIPEGDRQKGAMVFHSASPLYVTSTTGTSDELLWRGNRYRIMQLAPYADYGYYKAIAVKMDPSSGVSP